MGGHIGRQKMKLLHLRSPGNQFRPFEHTRVVESADGGLVGGASLIVDEFAAIINALK